jgi:hypothetical protein
VIDKKDAIELLARYEAQHCMEAVREGRVIVSDNWPDGLYRNVDEPVWVFTFLSGSRVGGSRTVVISRRTGAVIFDGDVGE